MKKTFKEVFTGKTNTTLTNIIAILGDSIISFNRGIKPKFNETLRSGWKILKPFPGASSKDLLNYIDSSLEDQHFEAAIIRTEINNILCDSSSRQINILLQNNDEIGKNGKSCGTKYVFISSITRNAAHFDNELSKYFSRKVKATQISTFRKNAFQKKNKIWLLFEVSERKNSRLFLCFIIRECK